MVNVLILLTISILDMTSKFIFRKWSENKKKNLLLVSLAILLQLAISILFAIEMTKKNTTYIQLLSQIVTYVVSTLIFIILFNQYPDIAEWIGMGLIIIGGVILIIKEVIQK